jgi:hypothetical protein
VFLPVSITKPVFGSEAGTRVPEQMRILVCDMPDGKENVSGAVGLPPVGTRGRLTWLNIKARRAAGLQTGGSGAIGCALQPLETEGLHIIDAGIGLPKDRAKAGKKQADAG